MIMILKQKLIKIFVMFTNMYIRNKTFLCYITFIFLTFLTFEDKSLEDKILMKAFTKLFKT